MTLPSGGGLDGGGGGGSGAGAETGTGPAAGSRSSAGSSGPGSDVPSWGLVRAELRPPSLAWLRGFFRQLVGRCMLKRV